MGTDEISEYESLEKDFNCKAQKNNNIGLIFVVGILLFPVAHSVTLHYVVLFGFFLFGLRWANYKKKACYYRGLIDGLQRLNKDDIDYRVSRMND